VLNDGIISEQLAGSDVEGERSGRELLCWKVPRLRIFLFLIRVVLR
jgi:hypothetical protein